MRLERIDAHRAQQQYIHSTGGNHERPHLQQHALQEIHVDQRDELFLYHAGHFERQLREPFIFGNGRHLLLGPLRSENFAVDEAGGIRKLLLQLFERRGQIAQYRGPGAAKSGGGKQHSVPIERGDQFRLRGFNFLKRIVGLLRNRF